MLLPLQLSSDCHRVIGPSAPYAASRSIRPTVSPVESPGKPESVSEVHLAQDFHDEGLCLLIVVALE